MMKQNSYLVCVKINDEDVYFEVPTIQEKMKILTDASYAMQIYNSLISPSTNGGAPEKSELESSMETQTEISQMVSPETDDFLWNDKNTLLLLEEYRMRKTHFRNPKIKKRNLWQQIVEVFSKHEYSVNEDILDKKFRNLKQTFMRIRDNQNTKKRTGQGNITWKYYDIMCDIFAIDKTVNLEINTIESFLPLQKKAKMEISESIDCQTTPNLLNIDASVSDISFPTHEACSSLLKPANKEDHASDKSIKEQNDKYINTTPSTKKKSRQGLLQYRQELLKTEKQRVSEISNLRKSIDESNKLLKELVETAKDRNKLLARLVEIEEKKKHN